jgi:hypothetical protein
VVRLSALQQTMNPDAAVAAIRTAREATAACGAGSSQFFGVLIGGGITLLATLITQSWTSRRDAARHGREEAERQSRELRGAYAEWLTAIQRAIFLLTTFKVAPERVHESRAFVTSFDQEICPAAAKVRLLEGDPEARERTTQVLYVLSTIAARTSGEGPESWVLVLPQVDSASDKLRELEKWILDHRSPEQPAPICYRSPD